MASPLPDYPTTTDVCIPLLEARLAGTQAAIEQGLREAEMLAQERDRIVEALSACTWCHAVYIYGDGEWGSWDDG